MEQDSRIWFPDGDVILKAEDGNVGFRVYREVLERESSVFKDIFAKSLPGARKMADDGCPVLDTTDRIHELRVFLDTLLCGADQYYLGDDPVAIDWEELSTLIQMGEKYGVRDLVETGIARLKKYYPTTLDTWDHLTRRRMSVNFPIRAAPRVLALAELTNTPTLLPGAYLDCCALATMTTYDLKFPKDGDDKADEPVYVNDLDVLAPAERARVMAAAERLATARTARMLAVHRAVPCEFCTRPERCALSAQRTMQEIELSTLRENARGRNLFEPVFEYFREGFEEYTISSISRWRAGPTA
ncbi:hypothetical protein C8Q77DRAFT_1220720 [Trametes polyzona]|nr:hypothetical protein C8Q77DRAFT_1220720 [Trametes polyzona]